MLTFNWNWFQFWCWVGFNVSKSHLLLLICLYYIITCIPFGNVGDETKWDDTTCLAFLADVNWAPNRHQNSVFSVEISFPCSLLLHAVPCQFACGKLPNWLKMICRGQKGWGIGAALPVPSIWIPSAITTQFVENPKAKYPHVPHFRFVKICQFTLIYLCIYDII